MDEISRQLHSPVFWVCTVCVSIIVSLFVNFISRYANAWIEKAARTIGLGSKRLFVRWNERRATRLSLDLAAFDEWVSSHPYGVQLALTMSWRKRASAAFSVALCIGIFLSVFLALLGQISVKILHAGERTPFIPDWIAWTALVASVLSLIIGLAEWRDSVKFDGLIAKSELFYGGEGKPWARR
jgi:hypothetical protein